MTIVCRCEWLKYMHVACQVAGECRRSFELYDSSDDEIFDELPAEGVPAKLTEDERLDDPRREETR